ncbi:LTA synthase family protein [Clostridium sp. JN-9]|uniref:LTA synthase family protein n=1 Tax=Clostridium sp. JN-9 TaxID=2507159 RepID=UPI000FFE12A6|nr:LTA synthase family protein [Clostridium sp. JN-9]QAT41194.1 LTA synthase family protein [Clostridium sp. JN-9]
MLLKTIGEKLKKPLNILLNNSDILIFFIIFFIKFAVYGKEISPDYFDKGVYIPIIGSILILLSIALLFNGEKRVKVLYIMDIVISVILIADLMYFRYYKDILTISLLRNAKLLTGVTSSVKGLIKLQDFLFLADIILMRPIKRLYVNKIAKLNKQKLLLRSAKFAVILAIGVAINGMSLYKVSIEQPTLLTSMSNRIYLTKLIGNLNLHAVDIYNTATNKIKNSKPLPAEKEKSIETFLSSNNGVTVQQKNLKGVAEGKNLIVIQVEALQQFVIDKSINGQEITPNLNKWLKSSLYFNNYFYQVAGGNTSDAEFMSNNSLYPAESGAAYYIYSGNTYNSLAQSLKSKNYYTAALHGNSEGFWNRNVMYKAEGFDDFYGQRSFTLDENVGLGLSDKSFLTQSVEKMSQFKKPYYSFLVTLSSHFPYNDTKGYGEFNVGEYEGTLLGNYLKAIHYTDEQLGMFLQQLHDKGMDKDSLIVLYGDHFAIPKENADELYKFENVTNKNDLQWYQYQKVPLIIHFPNDEYKGVNSAYCGQMDLYPTLANLLNLPEKNMFGNDILNSKEQKVIFRNGSFTDGKVFYISWTNTYYDISTGQKIPETAELKEKKEQYLSELQYSDDLLNHNLLKTMK